MKASELNGLKFPQKKVSIYWDIWRIKCQIISQQMRWTLRTNVLRLQIIASSDETSERSQLWDFDIPVVAVSDRLVGTAMALLLLLSKRLRCLLNMVLAWMCCDWPGTARCRCRLGATIILSFASIYFDHLFAYYEERASEWLSSGNAKTLIRVRQ